MSRKVIVILVLIFLLLAGGIGVAVYLYINTKEELELANTELDSVYSELLAYGDVKTVYEAKKELRMGADVRIDDFEPVDRPSSQISESYVLNPQSIVGSYYKINISKGTPLTKDLFVKDPVGKMDRFLDVVADLFPVEPNVGDFYDFRMTTPIGQDYIILTKKRVYNFYGSAVKLVMTENDIHRYKSALVDAYLNPGTLIYVTKYIEPSMQEDPTIYYPVSDRVLEAMELDPNLIDVAEQALKDRKRGPFEEGLELTKEQQAAISSGNSNLVGILKSASQSVLRQGQTEDVDSTETTIEATGQNPDDVNTNPNADGKTKTNNSGSTDATSDNQSEASPDPGSTIGNPIGNNGGNQNGADSSDPFYDNFYNPAEEKTQ